MSVCDQSLPYVRAISPYQPGKPITQLAREMGIPVERIVKLASNENPLGMSPKAKMALERAVGTLERYPDDFELKAAVAAHTGFGMERVVLGNGSNDLLDMAARVFLAPGRSTVFSQHAFAVYPLASLSVGAALIAVPAKDFGHDLDAMRAAVRPATRLIWIANPNNPTGTFIPYPQLKAFMQSVPADVVVVLDEAYNEYLDAGQQYGQQAADQPGFAGGAKVPGVATAFGHQPHQAVAAVDPVGFVALGFGQRLQTLAPLHQQACALFPAGAGGEGVECFVGGRWQGHCSSSRALSRATNRRARSSPSLYRPSDTRIAPGRPRLFSSGMAQ